MRKILLTLAALAAFGIAMPVLSNSANAETVVIKKKEHRDRGLHLGWRHRHHDRIVIKEGRRHHHHGAAVVVR